MKRRPKLILLNGAAASGKTTLAKKYLDDNPLTINIEGDEILTMMGQWLKYETEARELVYELTKSMTNTHLESGNDVLLPYLPVSLSQIENFEAIADKCSADFIEILLHVSREEGVRRILERGEWGEKGAPPVTENDIPHVERLYDDMMIALDGRSNMVRIDSVKDDSEGTYSKFLRAIDI